MRLYHKPRQYRNTVDCCRFNFFIYPGLTELYYGFWLSKVANSIELRSFNYFCIARPNIKCLSNMLLPIYCPLYLIISFLIAYKFLNSLSYTYNWDVSTNICQWWNEKLSSFFSLLNSHFPKRNSSSLSSSIKKLLTPAISFSFTI